MPYSLLWSVKRYLYNSVLTLGKYNHLIVKIVTVDIFRYRTVCLSMVCDQRDFILFCKNALVDKK